MTTAPANPEAASQTHYDLVVIGAGVAGLAAAGRAQASGRSVLVIDKGRRVGGRMATRRAEGFTFTHGAQYLTARTPEFKSTCADALADGALTSWQIGTKTTFIGSPTMRDFALFLGRGLEIVQSVEINHIDTSGVVIQLFTDQGIYATAAHLIVTPPAPQTASLLRGIAPELAATAESAEYSPCWTAMFGFESGADLPVKDQPFQFENHPVAWANFEAWRPGSQTDNHALVVQASADWSRKHLEAESQDVSKVLFTALAEMLPTPLPTPVFASSHRWRYAKIIKSASSNAPRKSVCGRIAVAGDWLGAARIETAFLTGLDAANILFP
jgi:renalase